MRKKNVVRNILVGTISTLVKGILGFLIRRIFVERLGAELLGLSGLLLSVIAALSLLELGVGTAIYYSLYEPLLANNKEKINAIIHLYKRIYTGIGICIFVVGLAIMPLLSLLVNTSIDIFVVQKIYLLMLFDVALSYFWGYYRTLISADQKEYIIELIDVIVYVLLSMLQVTILLLWGNYYLYLMSKLIFGFIKNTVIRYKARSMYPEIKKKSDMRLDAKVQTKLKTDIKTIFFINISSYLVFSTDNILLSKAAGLEVVAIYGSYAMIITTMNSLVNTILTRANASVGNFLLTDSMESIRALFNRFTFINFLITGMSSVALFTVFNPLIEVWLGPSFVWSGLIALILIYNNYSRHILASCTTFLSGAGMVNPFPAYKYIGLFEGLVNLAVSSFFIWGLGMGIYGVFLGTSVSTIVSTIALPYTVHRYILFEKQKGYFKRYLEYLTIMLAVCLASHAGLGLLRISSALLNILIGLFISLSLFLIVTIIRYRNADEYLYFRNIIARGAEKLRLRKV